ncbi:tetratricopeptide repeat protein [candidate division KSB1 bacterium]|nr:tetratricopeptide repeat protein [candidate division KSB1 bacterium]
MKKQVKIPWAFILIIVCILAVYSKSVFYDYTFLDDNALILDKYFFNKDLSNIGHSFSRDVFLNYSDQVFYRPVLTVSFILDAQFSKLYPAGYHITNIIIHILASCLLFVLFGRLGVNKTVGLFLTLVFAVHPALVQAVTWIPGRNDSLLGLLIFPSMIFFLSWINQSKWPYLLFHLLFFGLALLTKETALFFTFLCFIYLRLVLKKKLFSKNETFLWAGWILVVVSWFLLRQNALTNPMTTSLSSVYLSLRNNFVALFIYLGKIFFPFNLSVLANIRDTSLYFGIAATALMVLLPFIIKKTDKMLFWFGLQWYFIFLVPTFIRPDPAAEPVVYILEHRLYLPIIGILLAIAQLLRINWKNNVQKVLTVTVLAVLAVLAFIHTANFSNRITFWENAVRTSPNHPLSHRNLGAMYQLDGRLDEAEKEYEKSLQLNPLEPMVHNNLGLIYADRNEPEKAEKMYLKELEIYPGYDNALFNLGLLYYKYNMPEKAVELWEGVITVNPDHTDAYRNLMIYYHNSQNYSKRDSCASQLVRRGIPVPDFSKMPGDEK